MMQTLLVTIVSLLFCIGIPNYVNAHDDALHGHNHQHHHHHEEDESHHPHDDSVFDSAIEQDRLPDLIHRGLLRHNKDDTSSLDIGNRTYTSRQAFIHSGHRCGAKKPTAQQLRTSNAILDQWMTDNQHRMDQVTTTTTNIVIPTYIHIITNGGVGAITNTTITNQMKVLNDSYKSYGFTFSLKRISRINNAKWYTATIDSTDENAMQTKLRTGTAATLNVYFNAADGNLGYATLPSAYANSPLNDGVVIYSGTVPGGTAQYYNQGKTLVHEVGHWLGLLHTFDSSSCFGGPGDGVNDTPRQGSPTQGCPTKKDSCPLSSGLDMVSNYMDYSDDVCMNKFTTGQRNRMLAMWNSYRA
jgi:Pregnancy-associated plasma protein-A